EDYCIRDGYSALRMALALPPQAVIRDVERSGLRGRGGAGFPTGKKWGFVSNAQADQKYVICNADDGEPGTNKDRIILSQDPHSVFEGMALAAYAVGATQGFIYLRYEYTNIVPIIEEALANARAEHYLGDHILGSDFNFDITLVSGGGAYVCGEETALIESIEGRRGEPRFKPPYPGISGLYGKPTLVNNTETLANVPMIVRRGPDWFRSIGVPNCPGTKAFTLCGNIAKPGVYEYPMGTNLRDIFEAHGGVKDGHDLLGLMLGGQSGSLINSNQLDLPMDIDSCAKNDVIFGTGTIMVIDDFSDILDIVENIMPFFIHESCGKCTPCREGNKRILDIVQRINSGHGKMEDLDTLEDLASTMYVAALCGLGQASPVAVMSSLRNFRGTYVKAIERGVRG
ncbi:MAG: NADH-quinone oxidoreductase subunit NuoF, partial [Bacillota bacterium]|nr:NADH-quinone oxidoreductase subunit NuoF [Bacillota bacterium]